MSAISTVWSVGKHLFLSNRAEAEPVVEAANWKSYLLEIIVYYQYALMKQCSVPFTRLPLNSVLGLNEDG